MLSEGCTWRSISLSSFDDVYDVQFRQTGDRVFALVGHSSGMRCDICGDEGILFGIGATSAVDLKTGEVARGVFSHCNRHSIDICTLDSQWRALYASMYFGADRHVICRRVDIHTRCASRWRICDSRCDMGHHMSRHILNSSGGGVFTTISDECYRTKLYRLDVPQQDGVWLPEGLSHCMRDNNVVVSGQHNSNLVVTDLRQPDRIAALLAAPWANVTSAAFVSDNIVAYTREVESGFECVECAFDLRAGLICSVLHADTGWECSYTIVPHMFASDRFASRHLPFFFTFEPRSP
jgi:hypothetical protein